MSQIIKARQTKTMSKHMKFNKMLVIFQTSDDLKTSLASYILFLKHYGQIVFIKFIWKMHCLLRW